ncbi:Dolichyl-phosphate-mannose--protein mannosyltransferase 1 [Paramarasmius palmivorus]|uniref:Dolichyl-phosphate-mannose--protein mannosyltransferase 1 n=1 Tax=Paramarasmius palmivorus TaxID=297713 RepID=A0AAW0CKL6_9AGAR
MSAPEPEVLKSRIAVGSRVVLTSLNRGHALYTTAGHFYSTGSKQQVVSLSEQESTWQFINATFHETEPDWTLPPLTYIVDGMRVRLRHESHRNLHSHYHRPPISTNPTLLNEVSAYGLEGFPGDGNDDWIVEIPSASERHGELWTHIPFRLKHALTNCYLTAGQDRLPEWGLGNFEVYCDCNAELTEVMANTLWVVSSSSHPHVEASVQSDAEPASAEEKESFMSNVFASFNLFE